MQTALSLINQAYEEGWEELDLSGMELTEFPPENDRRIVCCKTIELLVFIKENLPHSLFKIQYSPLN